MSVKAVRYDRISYRLVEGDEVVGMAIQMADDRWILKDMDDRRIGGRSWERPGGCAQELERIRETDRAEDPLPTAD